MVEIGIFKVFLDFKKILCKGLGFFCLAFRASGKKSFCTIFQIFHKKVGPFWFRWGPNQFVMVYSGPTIKTQNFCDQGVYTKTACGTQKITKVHFYLYLLLVIAEGSLVIQSKKCGRLCQCRLPNFLYLYWCNMEQFHKFIIHLIFLQKEGSGVTTKFVFVLFFKKMCFFRLKSLFWWAKIEINFRHITIKKFQKISGGAEKNQL